MSQRVIFSGNALTAIDAKGRIAMPAEFRTLIARSSGDDHKFCLSLPDEAPYITCGTLGWREAILTRIEREAEAALAAGRDYGREMRDRNAFGSMIDVPFDASGRFIMPQFFRDEARLDDMVFFYGCGETFEIWNPRIFIETPGLKERDKRAAMSFMKLRGAS